MTDVGRFLAALERFQGGKDEALIAASQYLANQLYELSQERCPVRTGYLKSSGHIDHADVTGFQVSYTAPYAGFVNYGTSRMAPNPFFSDAVNQVRSQFAEIYSQRMKAFWASLGE